MALSRVSDVISRFDDVIECDDDVILVIDDVISTKASEPTDCLCEVSLCQG